MCKNADEINCTSYKRERENPKPVPVLSIPGGAMDAKPISSLNPNAVYNISIIDTLL